MPAKNGKTTEKKRQIEEAIRKRAQALAESAPPLSEKVKENLVLAYERRDLV